MSSFTEHPHSVGKTYAEHMIEASRCGVRLIGAGAACLVHAIAPWLFEHTASATVSELHERMVVNRRRKAAASLESSPAAR